MTRARSRKSGTRAELMLYKRRGVPGNKDSSREERNIPISPPLGSQKLSHGGNGVNWLTESPTWGDGMSNSVWMNETELMPLSTS